MVLSGPPANISQLSIDDDEAWRELPPTKKILKQPPPKNYRITIIHYGGVIFAGRGVGRDHNFAHEALFLFFWWGEI